MDIEKQIEEIKALFNTKKIYDECALFKMSDLQQMAVIGIIKNNTKDGTYTVDDDIEVLLNKGNVYIQDVQNG